MQTALQEVEMQLQMLAVSARQVHGIMRDEMCFTFGWGNVLYGF